MNRQVRHLATFLIVCFIGLFVRINQIQVYDADEINHRDGNTRLVERDFNRPRGRIVTADGRVVAESKETTGQFAYQREYPQGDLYSHVAGYYSFGLGSDGVEREYHEELAGQTPGFQFRGWTTPFDDAAQVGDVELTLDSRVQDAAAAALGEQRGSVVVLDVATGGVLAMVSTPRFDPNAISNNNAEAALAAKKALDADPARPLLARSYRERFAPGSTFKVVTAAAGLENGAVTEANPSFEQVASYTPPGTTRPIANFDGSTCGGTLLELLRVSCNAGFAEMAAELLGPEPMVKTAEAFGFNEPSPLDLPRPAISEFPTDFGNKVGELPSGVGLYEDTAGLAQSGIGQNSVTATPLEMAVVAATIANEGNRPTPHVAGRILDGAGDEVSSIRPDATGAISPTSADIIRRGMIEVVERGTANRMAVPGNTVGGKTGTAQTGRGDGGSHAWVIGFAGPEGEPPSVAIAVLVEAIPDATEQTGGRVAAPIAQRVLEAALSRS